MAWNLIVDNWFYLKSSTLSFNFASIHYGLFQILSLIRARPRCKESGFLLVLGEPVCSYFNMSLSDNVKPKEIDRYLKFLAMRREDWQVKQASEAIGLYLIFRRKKQSIQNNKCPDPNVQWEVIADDVKKMLRLKHLSLRTEQT
jgi:hypothetical protein